MLLVSVLSCFTLYGFMHVIGIIEGIMLFTKSDEAFVREYIYAGRLVLRFSSLPPCLDQAAMNIVSAALLDSGGCGFSDHDRFSFC